MALSEAQAWIGMGTAVITNIVTITVFLVKMKTTTEAHETEIKAIEVRQSELKKEQKIGQDGFEEDVHDVTKQLTGLLVTIEGFTREQTLYNKMMTKLVDGLIDKFDKLSSNQVQIQATQAQLERTLAEVLKSKGIIQ